MYYIFFSSYLFALHFGVVKSSKMFIIFIHRDFILSRIALKWKVSHRLLIMMNITINNNIENDSSRKVDVIVIVFLFQFNVYTSFIFKLHINK